MKTHTISKCVANFVKNSFTGLLIAVIIAITSTLFAADQTRLLDGRIQITSSTPSAFTFAPTHKWNDIKSSFTITIEPLLPLDVKPVYIFKYKAKSAGNETYVEFNNNVINAGLYTVQISATAPSFTFDSAIVDITVKPLKIISPIIALSSGTGIYKGSAYAVPTATVDTTINGAKIAIANTTAWTEGADSKNVGSPSITITAVAGQNYTFSPKIATFSITPKPVTIAYTAITGSTTYGQLATISTPVITGIVNNDTVGVTITAPTYKQSSVVGTYVWTATLPLTGTKAGNYTGKIDAGKEKYTLTVTPATLVTGTPVSTLAKVNAKLKDITIPTTTVTVKGGYIIVGAWKWEKDGKTDIIPPTVQNAIFTPTAPAGNFTNPTASVGIKINLISDIVPVGGKIFVAETGSGNGSIASTPASIVETFAYIKAHDGAVSGLNIVGDILTAIDATKLNITLVGMPQAPEKTVKIANITTDTEITGLVITGLAIFETGATLDKCTVVGATEGEVVAGSTIFFPLNSASQTAVITITKDKKIAKVDNKKKGIIEGNILYLSSDNVDAFGPKFTSVITESTDFILDATSVLINRGKAEAPALTE